jgi:hypothetical protein
MQFWGSSLIQSMPDVRKTAKRNNGTVLTAHVQGITLSSLLRRALLPFDKNGDKTKSGGSLLVKIDIEGAEYAILKELEATRLICDYVQMGNNATLVVEYHQHLIRDAEEKRQAMEGLKEAREKLKNCGVQFRRLPDFWTG